MANTPIPEKKSEKAQEKAGAGKPGAETVVAPKKVSRKRRNVPEGRVNIHAGFNNTIVTVAEPSGNVLVWASSGASGFRGSKKSTPYAAQVAAENAIEKAKAYGLMKAHVFVKGIGNGREQAIRGLIAGGIEILSITDVTPVPHNGCRKRRERKV